MVSPFWFDTINPLPHDSTFWRLWNIMFFENIMENGAFALLEQMFNFPWCFQKYSKFYLNLIFHEFFECLSKNRKWCHDLKIAYKSNGRSQVIVSK